MYDKYIQDLEKIKNQQIAEANKQNQINIDRINANKQNQINTINEQKPVAEQRFTDGAQGAFIRRKQAERDLPQRMSANGYSGGISESTGAMIDANYGNAYNSHERDYNNNLKEIANQVLSAENDAKDKLFQSDSQFNSVLSDINNQYTSNVANAKKEAEALAYQERLAQEQREYERKLEQERYARELAKAQAKAQATASAKAPKPPTTPFLNNPKESNTDAIYRQIVGQSKNDPSISMLSQSQRVQKQAQILADRVDAGSITGAEADAVAKMLGFSIDW